MTRAEQVELALTAIHASREEQEAWCGATFDPQSVQWTWTFATCRACLQAGIAESHMWFRTRDGIRKRKEYGL
jgi:hypothetical protein